MNETWQAIIGAVLLIIPGLVAVSCSLYMIYMFWRDPDTRSPFTTITTARCVSHLIDGSIYGFYYGTRLIFSIFDISWSNSYIDTITTGCWIVLGPLEFLLGLNRIVAINLPLQYPSIFSIRLTTVYVVISWMGAIWFYIFHLFCPISFSVISYEIEYTSKDCLSRDTLASEVFVFPAMGIAVFMALVAFFQVIYRTRKQGLLSNRRRWLLFAQAPLQILVWVITTMFWVSDFRNLSDSRLFLLLSLPFAQVLSHAVERSLYINGQGVEDEQDRPTVLLKDILNIIYQVATAVRHIHETFDISGREIVHGDLATRNVLMDRRDLRGVNVKLGDFGLPEGARPLAWLPPEIICAHHSTPKQTPEGDIWMFGVFMWECLTLGATPHFQRSVEEIQRSLRLPDRGLDCPNSCPLDVWTAVLECLSEAHRRPRCAGPEDGNHSLVFRLRTLRDQHGSSTHPVFAKENISGCTCPEHRCKGTAVMLVD